MTSAIDLWRIPAARLAPEIASLRALLTPAERARADAFRFAPDQARYAVFRGALRQVLGRHLNMAPERVALSVGPHGKPQLPGDALHFNLTHSGPGAVLAVATDGPIGVDIEVARSARLAARLAPRVLSDAESAAYDALPPIARATAFLRAWTCKEAYVKATGEGLSFPLPRITVALCGPARLLQVEGREDEPARWALHDLTVGWDVAGALAAPTGATLRWFDHQADMALGGAL
ncbi:MAG: 4'-phosphopantetheinyl transferase [Paracoccaceae bacterium]|jgi:4'-phosphopantetheinyl transferase